MPFRRVIMHRLKGQKGNDEDDEAIICSENHTL